MGGCCAPANRYGRPAQKARISDRSSRWRWTTRLRAIRRAGPCRVLVLDAEAVLDKQDLAIARWVVEEGRALVIAINKWDALADHKNAALQPASATGCNKRPCRRCRRADRHHLGTCGTNSSNAPLGTGGGGEDL